MNQALPSTEVEKNLGNLNRETISKNVQRKLANSSTQPFSANSRLELEVGNKRYKVENFSDYSFQIESASSFENGHSYDGKILDDGTPIFDIKFRTRKTSDNKIQCRFSDLSIEKKEGLSRYLKKIKNPNTQGDSLNRMSYDEIASGSTGASKAKSPADNTNDTPIDKPGARKSTRLLATLILLGAIIGIFFVFIYFVQARNQVTISNGALVGNYLPIQSSAEGLITNVAFRGGQEVKAGDVLFRVQNKEVEKEVAFAQAEIEQADAQVVALEQLIFDYHDKLELVAENITQRILIAKADLRKAQLESQSQNQITSSNSKLFDKGIISEPTYESSKFKQQILQADIQAKRAKVGMLEVDFKAATTKGILSMGDILEDQLGQLKSELTLANANKTRAVANLDAVSRNQVEVQAPTDGRIYAVYRQKGEFVKLAEPILSISLYDHYWASGSVSSDEAHRILPGQEVQVKLASMDLAVTGEVAAVGHRAVYTQGGWSQDFRSTGLSVPVKVWLPTLPEDVPSGLRMKMVVKLGFKWPWQEDLSDVMSAHAAEIVEPLEPPDETSTASSVENDSSSPLAPGAKVVTNENGWETKLASDLSAKFQGMGSVEVFQLTSGVVNIRINNKAGFASGGDALAREDRKTIANIGTVLLDHKDVHIAVEGHTDNLLPAATEKYATNQALSLARASSVQKFLEREVGLPSYRLKAIGKADSLPMASNATTLGRQANRRIEFSLTRRFEHAN